jgi:hypothetical protein
MKALFSSTVILSSTNIVHFHRLSSILSHPLLQTFIHIISSIAANLHPQYLIHCNKLTSTVIHFCYPSRLSGSCIGTVPPFTHPLFCRLSKSFKKFRSLGHYMSHSFWSLWILIGFLFSTS